MVYAPFPDAASAERVGRQLLDEKLVACVNIGGALRAIYDWNGERGEASEVAVLFKTRESLLDRAISRLAELHPYDTPAVLGWRCDAAAKGTADWLATLPA